MKWLKTTIPVGADAPFTVLHLSDTHLAFADARDDERKRALAERRSARFAGNQETLDAALAYAQAHGNMPILHTGDLMDFVSYLNLEKASALLKQGDFLITAGNHEFSQYVGEAVEDAAYRAQSLPRVEAAYGCDVRFSAREMHGVNFVLLDNSYYLIDKWQLDRLKEVVRAGKPVVLLMHVPLYTRALYDLYMATDGNPAVMAAPEALMRCYPEKQYRQQIADETTREAYDYILSEKRIKTLLTGHEHIDRDDPVTDTFTQYITDRFTIREITFTP